ncbi:MAG: hypothetical protein KF894_14300 [Labilithrix sp.]|nr:hypothetical protein [Labilithrix sp.]
MVIASSSESEGPRSPSTTGRSLSEYAELVLALALLWIGSALHVWSAVYVCLALASGTFGAAGSFAAVIVVVLPVVAQRVLSSWERLGSRGEIGDAVGDRSPRHR